MFELMFIMIIDRIIYATYTNRDLIDVASRVD